MSKVLVIEDDRDVVALLDELLQMEGYEVSTAQDGLEGLVKLATGRPDAVLLDIMMPDVDGHRVLKQLLEENDGEVPFPVIVITGSPEGAAAARVLLGRENVFEKPFDPQLLLDRLRDAVVGEA